MILPGGPGGRGFRIDLGNPDSFSKRFKTNPTTVTCIYFANTGPGKIANKKKETLYYDLDLRLFCGSRTL